MFDQYVLLSGKADNLSRQQLKVTPIHHGFEYTSDYAMHYENSVANGVFKFTIQLEYLKTDRGNYKVLVPQVKTSFRKANDIEREIFAEKHFFDQPSAARMLLGLLNTANRVGTEEAASAYMSILKDNFNFMFNCDASRIFDTLRKPVAKDMLEVAASEAILNMIIPYRFELKFQELLGAIFSINVASIHSMESFDMGSKDGLVRFTMDPELIDQIHPKDIEKYHKPSFTFKNGEARIKSLIFVEYHDTSKAGGKVCSSDTKNYQKKMSRPNSINDIVLLPIEIDFKFKPELIDGELFQEFHASGTKGKLKLQGCQYVLNKDIILEKGDKEEEYDEDEDFADFDDFNDIIDHVKAKSQRDLKNSDMQRLVCTLVSSGNQKIKGNPDIIGDYFSRMTDTLDWWFNTFSNTPEANNGNLGHAINVACSGWDVHPWKTRFEEDRIVISAKLN